MTKSDIKKTIVIIGGIVIGVLLLFAIKNIITNNKNTEEIITPSFARQEDTTSPTINNGIQEITLHLDPQTLDYLPNPLRLKAGIPVRITVDTQSVRGCSSSIVMPAFGIRKRAVPGDNIIEFTPPKAGTYPFSCSMGMSKGMIIVE